MMKVLRTLFYANRPSDENKDPVRATYRMTLTEFEQKNNEFRSVIEQVLQRNDSAQRRHKNVKASK